MSTKPETIKVGFNEKTGRWQVPEPSIADLVANLRARCDKGSKWLVAVPPHPDRVPAHVVLPVGLVLAIADAIETMSKTTWVEDSAEATALLAGVARDIVKLFVTKLFAPAKEEAEKAFEACENLGLTEEQAKEVVSPTSALEKWMPLVLGTAGLAIGGMLPWLKQAEGWARG